MILNQFKLFVQDHPTFFGCSDAILKRAEELANTSCGGFGKGQLLGRKHIEDLLPDHALREDFLYRLTTMPYLRVEYEWIRAQELPGG